jgi:hypothetical protein
MPIFSATARDRANGKKRQTDVRTQPLAIRLAVGLLALGTLLCAALTAPILWTALTDHAPQPVLTYRQCGTVKDDTKRLACFDDVFRRMTASSAGDVKRLSFGEILADRLNNPAREAGRK